MKPKDKVIIEAAERLFTRHGSKRVTIEEICREAGLSKPTFYKVFKNKVDLVSTIRDRYVDEGFARFDEISALEIPFPEKIDLMTEWKVRHAARIGAPFIRELVSIDDATKGFKRRYLANIREAQERGEVRGDIEPELLWLVVEKLGDLVKDGSWKRVCKDLGDTQRQLRTLLWYGLLTREQGGQR